MLERYRLLAMTCFLVTVVCATGDEVPGEQKHATTPSAAEIETLIGQLGDDDPARRQKAGKRLEAIGEPALAGLQQAARGLEDPDFRLRAAVTARTIVEALYGVEIRRFDPPHSLVQSVTFLPDGRVLSGHDDFCLRLWDAEKGKEVLRFKGHIGRVLGVAASPDGKQALTAGEDKTVRLWEIATGKELRQFKGHGDWVTHVEFSPDGKQALSCSGGHWNGYWQTGADQTARLWDIDTGAEVKRFTGHTGLIFQVAFVPKARQIVTCSLDKTVRVWDIKTGKEVHKLAGHTDEVRCVAVSLDGRRLVSGSMDGTLRVWEVETGKALHTIRSDTTFYRLALTPDGKRVVTLSWYGNNPGLRLWDVDKGKEIHRFFFESGWPTAVAISGDGRRIVSGDSQGQLRLWRLGK